MNLNRPNRTFANSAPLAVGQEVDHVLFSNAIEDTDKDGWMKLTEAGTWPHVAGMQKVTPEALANVVADFKSLLGSLKRKFLGVPIFIGHPDDPAMRGSTGHEDTKAYGWVQDMKVLGNELWIKPRWSEDGQKIIANAMYRFFSPRWRAKPDGKGNYEPYRLLSIGLTNNPNIPGEAIANEKNTHMKIPQWMKSLLAKLGFSNEQIAALESNSSGAPSEADILAKTELFITASNEAEANKLNAAAALANEQKLTQAARDEAEQHKTSFSNERAQRVKLLVAAGVRDGKIPATNIPTWEAEFSNSFDATLAMLEKAPVLFPTQGRQHAVDEKKTPDTNPAARRAKMVELANEQLPKHGGDWDKAWAAAKAKNPDVFSEASLSNEAKK